MFLQLVITLDHLMFRKKPQIPIYSQAPTHAPTTSQGTEDAVFFAANDVLNGADSGQSFPTSFD